MIISSHKWFLQFFQHKSKNFCEVFLFESILIRKKILWKVNFVLIKFSPNALLFEKLQNECKNPSLLHKADYTLITKYAKMGAKCEKWKVYSGVFRATFFAFRISHQGWHSRENSKNFVVYFFALLIKHEIRMKCERCIVNVSYFVMFREKHSRNVKSV